MWACGHVDICAFGHVGMSACRHVALGGLAVALSDRKRRSAGALSMILQTQSYPSDSSLARLLPALRDAAQVLRSIV